VYQRRAAQRPVPIVPKAKMIMRVFNAVPSNYSGRMLRRRESPVGDDRALSYRGIILSETDHLARGTESLRTRQWSKADSNHRSHLRWDCFETRAVASVTISSLGRYLLMSTRLRLMKSSGVPDQCGARRDRR
jgi:hypothetical protein